MVFFKLPTSPTSSLILFSCVEGKPVCVPWVAKSYLGSRDPCGGSTGWNWKLRYLGRKMDL